MVNVLLRSCAIATGFSLAILLILGVSEHTGNLWFGQYFFIFAVVAYGLMLQVGVGQGPSGLPVVVEWLTLLPAMVAFYTPVVAVCLLWRRQRAAVSATRPN